MSLSENFQTVLSENFQTGNSDSKLFRLRILCFWRTKLLADDNHGAHREDGHNTVGIQRRARRQEQENHKVELNQSLESN
jgi:hypothetical protein